MKTKIWTGLIACSVIFNSHAAGKKVVKPLAKKVKVSVIAKKKRKSQNFDERKQTLEATLKIINENRVAMKGYKTTLYAVGRSARDKKVFKVMVQESGRLDIASRKTNKDIVASVVSTYDDRDNHRYGYQYYSYLVVMKDSTGKDFLVYSPRSSLKKYYKEIVKFASIKSCFNLKGKKVAKIY